VVGSVGYTVITFGHLGPVFSGWTGCALDEMLDEMKSWTGVEQSTK